MGDGGSTDMLLCIFFNIPRLLALHFFSKQA